MVLSLLLASCWLGPIVVPVGFGKLVLTNFALTLCVWGLGTAWEVIAAWEEGDAEKADTDTIIYTFVCWSVGSSSRVESHSKP
jgi:hypothetical protein